jgi:hypothetical protein
VKETEAERIREESKGQEGKASVKRHLTPTQPWGYVVLQTMKLEGRHGKCATKTIV